MPIHKAAIVLWFLTRTLDLPAIPAAPPISIGCPAAMVDQNGSRYWLIEVFIVARGEIRQIWYEDIGRCLRAGDSLWFREGTYVANNFGLHP